MAEPFTPGPHAEFCSLLQEQLVERLTWLQERAAVANQITMSTARLTDESLERMERIYHWNCDHVRTPYHLVESGFAKSSDVFDPRSALLQFMIAATPSDAVVADILDNHDQIIVDMTSWFEPHLIGDSNAVLVEKINNVPDTVSPVKAKPVYIQLPDGDKITLMQAWRVSELDFHTVTTLSFLCSLRLRCRIIGMRLLFHAKLPIASSLSSTGHPTLPYPQSPHNAHPPHTMYSRSALTILLKATALSPKRILTL